MADFVSQLGGTQWAGVSTQYFQTGSRGEQEHIGTTFAVQSLWSNEAAAGGGYCAGAGTDLP